MGQERNFFQGQSSGTAITPANSDDFGDDPITIGGSPTSATYDNTHVAPDYGSMGSKLVLPATATAGYEEINFATPSVNGSAMAKFYYDGTTPTAVFTVGQLVNVSNSSCAQINMSTGKRLTITGQSANAFVGTYAMGAGDYAVILECVSDVASNPGSVRYSLYKWNTSTLVWDEVETSGSTPTFVATRGGNIAKWRYGRVSATNNGITNMFISGLRTDDTGTRIPSSAFKPVNIAPTANAGPDQTVEPFTVVTLAGTASDPDGTVASVHWDLISTTGPSTPSLSNPAILSPTYTCRGTWHTGHDDTWQLTATDNLGATSTDTVVIHVNPATIGIITNPGTGAVTALQLTTAG